MSRIGYAEDETFPGQFSLWQANCGRSLQSQKGQGSLRELEAALLALPTKRLVANEFDNGTDVCAIGALARFKGLKPEGDTEYEMEEVGVQCGMPRLVAWKVVEVNDFSDLYSFSGPKLTPERRYDLVLDWVRRQLAKAKV